jgi:predicted adenylyl cyclase CyaB
MKNVEVEIQVEIENVKPLVDLMENKAKFLYEDHQIDQYYMPAHRDFTKLDPMNEWLRLRDSNGKYSITYKNWQRNKDKKSHHCDEYETTIGDIDQLKKILEVLNFSTVVIVDKQRKAYLYKDWEIALDKVKDLGDFIEIEYKGKKIRSSEEIVAEMKDFLKALGLGKIKINSVGYAFKLLKPNSDHLEEEL